MSNLGNKITMSNNLKKYLKINNISRNQLSESLGISYSTISDWINGKAYPRIDKIEMMANYFGINKSDLVEEHFTEEKNQGLQIPVLGTVPAGISISAIEDIIDYEEIPQSWSNQGEFFGLKIKGDSMYPTLENGDVVIVKKQSTADNGDTVIVMVNGDDATCKRYERSETGIMLIPNNSAYNPVFYTNEEIEALPLTIIGKVVELRRKF